MKRGSIVKTCPCGKEFKASPWHVEHGKGKFCSPPCAMKGRKQTVVKQKTTSITPKAADRQPPVGDDKGVTAICARCQQPRAFGQPCPRCEWRAFEGVAS